MAEFEDSPPLDEIKRLREETGAGWLACRKALIEAHNANLSLPLTDFEIAIELLRVKRAAA
jgi:translation elongation factor EF-Ts